jgi:hypothetical protein
MVGYWRRVRSRRRPPDNFFFDSNQSSSSAIGDRHYSRNVRTAFLCGCRIDVSFTPRGQRGDNRRTSLLAEVNTASLTARVSNLLEFDPGGPGDPMGDSSESMLRDRLSRGTRRRLALCGFDVYATPNTSHTRTRATRRKLSNSIIGDVRLSFESNNFENESSISSSRVGEFVYSSTTMMSAPMLEPQPQFETPPPDDISDIDDLSDRGWLLQLPPLATDLTLGALPSTRPRSRISVGCNGWITADSPPKSMARLSEIEEGTASPEQSQFSIGIGDDTSDTISKYAADSFIGQAQQIVNFDLISVEHESSRGGDPARASMDSASPSSTRERRRVSPAGSFSLDEITRRSDDIYRITEDAALLRIPRFASGEGDKKSISPPVVSRKSKTHHGLFTFRNRRSRQQASQQQQSSAPPSVLSQSSASLRPSIIYID